MPFASPRELLGHPDCPEMVRTEVWLVNCLLCQCCSAWKRYHKSDEFQRLMRMAKILTVPSGAGVSITPLGRLGMARRMLHRSEQQPSMARARAPKRKRAAALRRDEVQRGDDLAKCANMREHDSFSQGSCTQLISR